MRRLSIPLILAALALAACGDGGGDASPGDVHAPDDGVAANADTTAPDAADTDDCEADEDCGAGAGDSCGTPRCLDGSCVVEPRPDGTPCDDEDVCTLETTCRDGVCEAGLERACDDGDPCTVDSCDPATGCRHDPAPLDQACDDGDPCTIGDRCRSGGCSGSPDPACACASDSDCEAFLGGDACSGSLGCVEEHCRLEAGSPVTCADPGTCRVATCAPDTGACTTQLAPDGIACSDGNACTTGDTCRDGACAGTPGGCECERDADCADFQRGDYDLCQGPLVCLEGACAPDPDQRVTCDGGAPGSCVTTACESSTGLCTTVARADGTACEVAAGACEAPGACQQGQCVATGPQCDDGDPCTDDVCSAAGCQHLPAPGPCDDGDPCTKGEACEGGLCVGGKPVSCDDLNPCTVDTCSAEAGGCANEPVSDGTACATSDLCLGEGICVDGACAHQAPVSCPEPSGPCATAACVPGEGCVVKPAASGAPCDDGDPCTDGDACKSGACVSSPRSCNDANPCTLDECSPESGGCVHVPVEDGASCPSPDPCLEEATCQAGVCGGGLPVECEDGPCRTRGCDPGTGACVVVEVADDGSACGDGDPCSVVGSCKSGGCVGNVPIDCDDGDACTVDACHPETGSCEHSPVVCTPAGGDACAEATCDSTAGCVEVLSPVCEDATVLWSSSIPCDGDGWSFEGTDDGPGFVIDDDAAPPGPWDGDCALRLAVAGGDEAGWTADALAALPDLAGAATVTVHFVEWWSGASKAVGVTRHVGFVDAEGTVLEATPVVMAEQAGPGWVRREVTLNTGGAYEGAHLLFRVEASPPTVEAAWYVDGVVITAGAP